MHVEIEVVELPGPLPLPARSPLLRNRGGVKTQTDWAANPIDGVDRLRVGGRGAARAEDAQGTPTQSHISPSILVYEENSYMQDGM